jgi:hypothetical protein
VIKTTRRTDLKKNMHHILTPKIIYKSLNAHELIGQMKTKNMCPYYANGSKKLKGVF